MAKLRPTTAILAGSGFYELSGMDVVREERLDTPFGAPSDPIRIGNLAGRPVAFLARHGAGHRLLPSEINHRANVFALKSLGVERILSASAVGSMRYEIRPREMVLVNQFIDRTAHRPASFFGAGIAAHISFADPVCDETRLGLLGAARRHGVEAHDGGTYVCIEGPAFSTRAESELYRSWDVSVIGMTNLQEAKLAREAEICYATLAMVTDYDCWHDDEDDVSVGGVLANLAANGTAAAAILVDALENLPEERGCDCGRALDHAIITRPEAIDRETRERLRPIIGRLLGCSP